MMKGKGQSSSGILIQEAKSSSSKQGQLRLHFPKLSGKLSCPPPKEKQIPTDTYAAASNYSSLLNTHLKD